MVARNKTEVSITGEMTDDLAASFSTLEDALAYFNAGVGVVAVEDVLGDGYEILRDKSRLVNMPFLIIDWKEILGDTGPYTTIRLITSDARRYRLSDGSSGIHKQLSTMTSQHGLSGGVSVKGGLRKSTFWLDRDDRVVDADDPDATRMASTYYLNA